MFQSQIFSKLSRLALLSVFCAGLFVVSGELSISTDGVGIVNGGIESVMAAEDPKSAAVATAQVTNGLIEAINIVIGLLGYIMAPLVMLAGWLLSPDWTFGDIFGLRPILHSLWVLISNVVYVIFGFILVGIAFANIFGAGGAEYEMKKMLPKLVIGMLMVPFTWFIVSAVLSISNILTASVIRLPIDTINKISSSSKMKEFFDKEIIPKYIWVDLTADNKLRSQEGGANGGSEELKSNANGDYVTMKCPDGCLSINQVLGDEHGGAYNLLTVYAYGIFNIDKIKNLESKPLSKTIGGVTEIVKKLGFGFIYFVIFGILLVAIVYALFTRAIMLWMFAIFSPLFALNIVLGGTKSKTLERLGKFDIKHFISLAMVPVYVSAALAFGLMFLSLVMNQKNYTSTDNIITFQEVGNKEGQQFQFGSGPNAITLITIGNFDDDTGVMEGAFASGQGVISTTILGLLALVILWMAVMAALGANEITAAAVKPISDMGDSVGGLIKQAPSYIPIPGTKGQSIGSITKGTTQIAQDIGNIQTTKANEFNQKYGIAKYRELSSAVSAAGMEVQKITQGAKGTDPNVQAAVTKIGEAMKKGESIQNLSQQANFRDLIADFGGKIGVTIDKASLATADGLTKALAAIETKQEDTGGSGLLGKIGSSIVRDDYDNFIKTGSGGGKDEAGTGVSSVKEKEGSPKVFNATAKTQAGLDVNITIKDGTINLKEDKDDLVGIYKGIHENKKDLIAAIEKDFKGTIKNPEAEKLAEAIWKEVEKKKEESKP